MAPKCSQTRRPADPEIARFATWDTPVSTIDEPGTEQSFRCELTRDEVVTHTPSHFLQTYQSRDSPPVPYPDNEPNEVVPPSLTLSAWGFRYRSCISLEGSGPRGNDPTPDRPPVARPTTIVHCTSQPFRSCTRSRDFSHSASDENPLESSSPEVGGVPGAIHSQEMAIDKGPFAFTPSQLASLLDSKDLSALEAIGGVESLLRGLGTHPTRGLLIRTLDCGSGYSCSQRPRTKGKGRLVEPHTHTSIVCDHAGDRRDPYNATLQERKQIFGENFFLPRVKKSWFIMLMDKALVILQHCRTTTEPVRALNKKMKGVQVVRDGIEHSISVGEVVVGDIALLAPGEIIPCDGIFLSGHNVTCDESAMRGETTVVKKAPFSQCVALKQVHPQHVVDANNHGSAPRDTWKHCMDCFIVSGSKVLGGFGRYVVVAVGTTSRTVMAHGTPARVLPNKSFKQFFTRLYRVPHPKVFPTVGSDTGWNPSIGLDYAPPTYLRGCRNIPVSFVAMHTPHFGPPEDDPPGSVALLRVGASQDHPKNNHSLFDNNKAGTLDIQLEACDLANRASRYCLNLGDMVHRDSENFVAGGSAFVYRGTLDPEGTAVAVKIFRFGHKSDIGVIKSFCREVHIWSKLHHNNVLPVLGFTTKFDHTISIVSPWMERGNAHDYVQNVHVDPRPLFVGIATGLQYLHGHEPNSIYHGDLKGFNVLISDDGRPLLADFGFAFIVDSSFSMDVEGSRGGTPQWMAPEYFGLWEGSTADEGDPGVATAEGDVWSFGMTILELFTRQRPFSEVNSVFQLIPRLLRGHPRPSDEASYFRLTDEWWNICLLCWHLDPLKRPRMTDILAKIPMGSSHV